MWSFQHHHASRQNAFLCSSLLPHLPKSHGCCQRGAQHNQWRGFCQTFNKCEYFCRPCQTLTNCQYINSQVQLSDRPRLPYIQAVLIPLFPFPTTWSCFSKEIPTGNTFNKGSSRDCAFSLCPSYSATSQDHRTNPGSTFTNSLGCFSNNIFVRLENMCCQLEVWFRW